MEFLDIIVSKHDICNFDIERVNKENNKKDKTFCGNTHYDTVYNIII